MLAVTRYRVPEEDGGEFRGLAEEALRVLAARPGFAEGRVGRAVDDPELWTLTTSWESVGAYRRALGNDEVKLVAHPLMYRAIDEPTAFEDLTTIAAGGEPQVHESARAGDPSARDGEHGPLP